VAVNTCRCTRGRPSTRRGTERTPHLHNGSISVKLFFVVLETHSFAFVFFHFLYVPE